MKHLLLSLSIAVAASLSTLPASAASKQLWSACKSVDEEGAIGACSRILSRPEAPLAKAIAHYNRARAYLRLRELDRAMADLDQSVALSPLSPIPRLQRGITLAWKEQFDRAFAEFSTAIELQPQNARAYVERGKTRIWLKDFDGAISDLSRAIALDPKNPAAHRARAIAFGHLENLDRAKADLARALMLEARRAGVRVLQAGI